MSTHPDLPIVGKAKSFSFLDLFNQLADSYEGRDKMAKFLQHATKFVQWRLIMQSRFLVEIND
jgi:hypothetical protein